MYSVSTVCKLLYRPNTSGLSNEQENSLWCMSACVALSNYQLQTGASNSLRGKTGRFMFLKSVPLRWCVQSLWLISSLVVSTNSSPGSSEVSHAGIQMSQMNGRTRSGRQSGATGGMGTASGRNRRASMYVCAPMVAPYKALGCVSLTDIRGSLQGVSSETGNTVEPVWCASLKEPPPWEQTALYY